MSDEFDLTPDLLYLNHAAVSPWPKRTVEAVRRFADENGRLGSRNYPQWVATEQRLKTRLARLIGAEGPGEIALAKSTSEALSMIAWGLRWEAGDNVVGIIQEFPSNRVVWQSLASLGVQWRALDLDTAGADPEAELMALCDERTRIVAVSWVQYARGLRLDLERLARLCRERGFLLCVDGIQGLGALPFDLARMPVDFLVADGHKWLLGPEGLALLYCNPALMDHLALHQFGWHMVADMGDFDRRDWHPADDARRFECGSPNMLGIHALDASLSLVEEQGMAAIEEGVTERIVHLEALSDAHGFEMLSPREPSRRAGILTLRIPDIDQQALHKALMSQGLMCASRGGGIRLSPHFYTPFETLERAMTMIADTAARQP